MSTSWLDRQGLINKDTEDLGVISSSKMKMEYAYYCSSVKCAGVVKNEIHKFTTSDWEQNCPDCGGLLHSKRTKPKKV